MAQPSKANESLPWQANEIAYSLEVDSIESATQLAPSLWQPTTNAWVVENFTDASYWFDSGPKTVWFRIDLSQRTRADQYWIEIASGTIQGAELFYRAENSWQSILANQPPYQASQGVPNRRLGFILEASQLQQPLFLRVTAPRKINVQVQLWERAAYFTQSQFDLLVFAISFGCLAVMLLYNLIVGQFLKDSLYHFYAMAIGATLLYQTCVHGYLRLFAPFDWSLMLEFTLFLGLMVMTATLEFTRRFIELRSFSIQLDTTFRWIIRALIATAILMIFLPGDVALNITLLVGVPLPILTLYAGARGWYLGKANARIFTIAWGVYIIGASFWLNHWVGLTPLTRGVEFTFAVGAALESILLSVALAYRIQRLKQDREQLRQSHSWLEQLSVIDELSAVGNRRAFEQAIAEWVESGKTFGVAIVDIDHFKEFNDTWGHPEGDKVIAKLGNVLNSQIRDLDMAARIGGEEFAIIIDTRYVEILQDITERIRVAFNNLVFDVGNNQVVKCSLSAGFALSQMGESQKSIMKRADMALYEAKQKGRNCAIQARDKGINLHLVKS